MDVVQVPFRRILGRLVWFDHPLSIDDELVPCRATVWYLDGSREEVLRRSGEREGFRPLVKVAGDDYGLGGRRRPEQVQKLSEREMEREDVFRRSIPLNDELVQFTHGQPPKELGRDRVSRYNFWEPWRQ